MKKDFQKINTVGDIDCAVVVRVGSLLAGNIECADEKVQERRHGVRDVVSLVVVHVAADEPFAFGLDGSATFDARKDIRVTVISVSSVLYETRRTGLQERKVSLVAVAIPVVIEIAWRVVPMPRRSPAGVALVLSKAPGVEGRRNRRQPVEAVEDWVQVDVARSLVAVLHVRELYGH